jgi:gamma-glutamyltranspeptidase/glutathione hydrolase
LTALVALGIIEGLEASGKLDDILKLEHNSVEYLHILIESLRLAFAGETKSVHDGRVVAGADISAVSDTRYYVTDPEIVHVPVKEMLSKVSHLPVL